MWPLKSLVSEWTPMALLGSWGRFMLWGSVGIPEHLADQSGGQAASYLEHTSTRVCCEPAAGPALDSCVCEVWCQPGAP